MIEKCINQNSDETKLEMIQEIGKKENIAFMILDQYANYGKRYTVVQRAVSLAPPELQKTIVERIKMHSDQMKKDQCGKRVLSKLVKTYPRYF